MPLKLIKGKTLPIGVDLGSRSVKMAQLRTSENELELLAAGSVETPRSTRADVNARLSQLGEAIRKLMKSHNFKGNQAVLSIPAEDAFVQHVKLPKLPPEQVLSALQTELRGKLPYAIEDAVVRYIIAGDVYGEGDPKQEVIAVSASRKTLDGYLNMARRCKLDVSCVNVEPCAIVECFGRLFRRASDASKAVLFIDLGARSTQVVLAHGSRIVFARNLSRGGDHFDQAVAKMMNVSMDQAHTLRLGLVHEPPSQEQQDKLYGMLTEPLNQLAEETTMCLRYYESVFRNQAVERAIFVGGQASDKRLCQLFAQRINLPAQIGDPFLRVRRTDEVGSDSPDRREPQPMWAVAVGLSLGAAQAA